MAQNLTRRPREGGDPNPLASIVAEGLYSRAKTKRHGVWIPAFAGTTCRSVGTSRLLQRLQLVILRLRPAGTGSRIVMQRDRRLAEGLAIRLDHGLSELREFRC